MKSIENQFKIVDLATVSVPEDAEAGEGHADDEEVGGGAQEGLVREDELQELRAEGIVHLFIAINY